MNYKDIFDKRGNSYNEAMVLYPDIRKNEFLQALNKLNLENKVTILDIPSGGGYLKKLLPSHCHYLPYDFSNTFSEKITEKIDTEFKNLDIAISIAGVHHFEDKTVFFKNVLNMLSKDGVFVLSDVEKDSKEAIFLDNFVDKYTETGHSGIFLSDHTNKELKKAGFNIQDSNIESCFWVFNNEDEIIIFFNLLFGLKNCPDKEIIHVAYNNLNCYKEEGVLIIPWQLRTIVSTLSI